MGDAMAAPQATAVAVTRDPSVVVAHWVIPELDAHGEIDSHAAMCMRFTIDALLAGGAAAIVIDLRDVTAVEGDGRALLINAHRACRAAGVDLGLLMGVGVARGRVAGSLERAGLDTQLHPPQRPAPAPAPAPAPRRSPRPRHLPALQWVMRTGRE
jgi:anti-anti-sigma regulatory factor